MPSLLPNDEKGYRKLVAETAVGLRRQVSFLNRSRGQSYRRMKPEKAAARDKAARIIEAAAELIEQRLFADFGEE